MEKKSLGHPHTSHEMIHNGITHPAARATSREGEREREKEGIKEGRKEGRKEIFRGRERERAMLPSSIKSIYMKKVRRRRRIYLVTHTEYTIVVIIQK